jgi:hypothetical protein
MEDNYDITLIQSTLNSSITRTVYGRSASFRDAITPVLSVINPMESNSTVDINLQCLKPISAPVVPGAKNTGTVSRITWMSLSGLLAVQMGFWML